MGPYPGDGDSRTAIDQGTTTSRAVLYDLEGHIIAQAYREVYSYHPQPGWKGVFLAMYAL